MSITNIFFSILTALIAIIIGLLLRRLLVRRLKNTVLDNWIIQTLGIIIILPPLIIGAVAVLFIVGDGAITFTWQALVQGLPTPVVNFIGLAWIFIETVLVIVLGVGIARTLMKITVRGLGENRIDINIRTLIGRIFYIITVLIAIFWILAIWHVAVELPVAVLGTLTVAIVFAIQDILKDLVAGFYILMEHPFHIGDQITIGDETQSASHTGIVEDVQIRATKLRIVTGEQVTVPNALVFGGIVINNSFYGERRATITVTLPQQEFVKDETVDQIIKALKGIEAVVVKPEPTAIITGYTGNSITLTVRYWIANRQLSTISEVMYTLRTILPNADLAILEPAGNI
ncbi:MAG: mechanosensitive ion channel family protein [Ktedonobacteraceae bacterium]